MPDILRGKRPHDPLCRRVDRTVALAKNRFPYHHFYPDIRPSPGFAADVEKL
jgi:hypothetical protein